MNFLHAVVISIAINMMGFQLCLRRISSCPRIAFPFFMNRTQFGSCIRNLSREEKGD